MEGQLWKWTNYWNGWQSRWFILDDGILSYYTSYEDVNQGSRGSISVSACEITVHPTDQTRLDLCLSAGEKYMYLKAATEKERQQWLVALGSAKACFTNRPGRRISSCSAAVSESSSSSASWLDHACRLKTKKSELRLYCDLLMQQVHTIRDSVSTGNVNTDQIDEGSGLLSQTCDTFIQTLDEVMSLSECSLAHKPRVFAEANGHAKKPDQKLRKGSPSCFVESESEDPSGQKRCPLDSGTRTSPGFRSLFGDLDNCPCPTAEQKQPHSSPGGSPEPALRLRFPSTASLFSAEAFLHAAQESARIYDIMDHDIWVRIQDEVLQLVAMLQHIHRQSGHRSDQALDQALRQEENSELITGYLILVQHLIFLHSVLRSCVDAEDTWPLCLDRALETCAQSYPLPPIFRSLYQEVIANSDSSSVDRLGRLCRAPCLVDDLEQMHSCLCHLMQILGPSAQSPRSTLS